MNLSEGETAAWLMTAADSEEAKREIASPLMRWLLAARALDVLGYQPPAIRVAEVIESMYVDGRYAAASGEPDTWPATQWAVELAGLAGLSVPDEVRAAIREALPRVTAEASNENALNSVLPVWHLASRLLPSQVREPMRKSLAQTLLAFHERAVSASESDGVSLGVLADIRMIAEANRIALPALSPAFAGSLRTTEGSFAASLERPMPEPQVTYYAAKLGAPATERFAQVLQARAGRTGWRNALVRLDPETSFYARQVMQAFGLTHRDDYLRAVTGMWLADHSVRHITDHRQARRQFFVVALGQALNMEVPEEVRARVQRSLEAANIEPQIAVSPRLVWLIRLATTLEITLSAPIRNMLNSVATDQSPDRIDAVYRAALIGRVLDDESLAEHARGLLPLFVLDSSYRLSPSDKWADLRATCAGTTLEKRTSQVATEPFAVEAGTLMWPVGAPVSAWLTTESVYLGLVTAGALQDTHMLCFGNL